MKCACVRITAALLPCSRVLYFESSRCCDPLKLGTQANSHYEATGAPSSNLRASSLFFVCENACLLRPISGPGHVRSESQKIFVLSFFLWKSADFACSRVLGGAFVIFRAVSVAFCACAFLSAWSNTCRTRCCYASK